VAGIDFYFTVHLCTPSHYEGLLNEVANSVLGYVGCAAFNASEILERLDAQVLRLTCAGR
jgi:hypothetical protein